MSFYLLNFLFSCRLFSRSIGLSDEKVNRIDRRHWPIEPQCRKLTGKDQHRRTSNVWFLARKYQLVVLIVAALWPSTALQSKAINWNRIIWFRVYVLHQRNWPNYSENFPHSVTWIGFWSVSQQQQQKLVDSALCLWQNRAVEKIKATQSKLLSMQLRYHSLSAKYIWTSDGQLTAEQFNWPPLSWNTRQAQRGTND